MTKNDATQAAIMLTNYYDTPAFHTLAEKTFTPDMNLPPHVYEAAFATVYPPADPITWGELIQHFSLSAFGFPTPRPAAATALGVQPDRLIPQNDQILGIHLVHLAASIAQRSPTHAAMRDPEAGLHPANLAPTTPIPPETPIPHPRRDYPPGLPAESLARPAIARALQQIPGITVAALARMTGLPRQRVTATLNKYPEFVRLSRSTWEYDPNAETPPAITERTGTNAHRFRLALAQLNMEPFTPDQIARQAGLSQQQARTCINNALTAGHVQRIPDTNPAQYAATPAGLPFAQRAERIAPAQQTTANIPSIDSSIEDLL